MDVPDLLDAATFANGPPYEAFATLRREAPVSWHPHPNAGGFRVITKHADVVAISRDSALFSSELKGYMPAPEPDPIDLEQSRRMLLGMARPQPSRRVRRRRLALLPGREPGPARDPLPVRRAARSRARDRVERARGAPPLLVHQRAAPYAGALPRQPRVTGMTPFDDWGPVRALDDSGAPFRLGSARLWLVAEKAR